MKSFLISIVATLALATPCLALDLDHYNVTLMCADRQPCIDRELAAREKLANMRFSKDDDRLLQMILNTSGFEGALGAIKKMHIRYEEITPSK